MAERLAGKVALISGGARGMGASHVRMLVAEGAKVVFGDILDDEGKAVAAEVGDAARYRAPRRDETRGLGMPRWPPPSASSAASTCW